MPKATN